MDQNDSKSTTTKKEVANLHTYLLYQDAMKNRLLKQFNIIYHGNISDAFTDARSLLLTKTNRMMVNSPLMQWKVLKTHLYQLLAVQTMITVRSQRLLKKCWKLHTVELEN